MATALIILAAGQGTRMNSDRPKVLHPLAGVPLLAHVLRAGAALAPARCVVVAGHGASEVAKVVATLAPAAEVVTQPEQLGTANAVAATHETLANFSGDAIVLYGDTPLIRPETLARMLAARAAGNVVVVLGFNTAEPGGYGRLITEGDALDRIVEAKDATREESNITLCNSGVICADCATLLKLAGEVGNDNASGEYYLTDIVALARAKGLTAAVVPSEENETRGVNSRADLARAEAAFQTRARTEALARGVTLVAPETVHFAYDTMIGRDAVIGPNVVFGPGVTVETGAEIRAFCHLEGCHVSCGAIVGPFARLRPGAEIAESAHVGNFVEIKNAVLGEGAKANHLSYIGDASIGACTNIGAGTITCNYDGVSKHRTVIGARAFIGSNTALVAPVTLGDDAMTGSGSVITRDVPDGALALARARQENKPGLAIRMLQKLNTAREKARKVAK